MSEEQKENDFIKIKEWPPEYAYKAYENKHYIEAIQVLHGFIETKLQELLILTGAIDHKRDIRTYGTLQIKYRLLIAVKSSTF